MKKYLIVALLGFCLTAQAQTIPFEKLDSISAAISRLERQTETKSYKDVNGDIYELSFPMESFKVWSHDRLATKAVYKKSHDKEILVLTESIDCSKATGISVAEDYNGVTYIKVDFPKGHLTSQIIENGKIVDKSTPNFLEFYCRYGTVEEKVFVFDKMFDYLYFICNQLKIEKGILATHEIKNEREDWNRLSSEDFTVKYPTSLMLAQIEQNKLDALRGNQKFILAFANRYNFKPGLTLSEFAGLSPDNKTLAEQETDKYGSKTNKGMLKTGRGPYQLTIKNEKVIGIEYMLTSDKREVLLIVDELMNEIGKNIDAKYLQDNRTQYSGKYDFDYSIKVPGAPEVTIWGRGHLLIRFYAPE